MKRCKNVALSSCETSEEVIGGNDADKKPRARSNEQEFENMQSIPRQALVFDGGSGKRHERGFRLQKLRR